MVRVLVKVVTYQLLLSWSNSLLQSNDVYLQFQISRQQFFTMVHLLRSVASVVLECFAVPFLGRFHMNQLPVLCHYIFLAKTHFLLFDAAYFRDQDVILNRRSQL